MFIGPYPPSKGQRTEYLASITGGIPHKNWVQDPGQGKTGVETENPVLEGYQGFALQVPDSEPAGQ